MIKNFHVREAMHSELQQITDLAVEFFHESNFGREGLTVDTSSYMRMLQNYRRYAYVSSLVALDDDNNLLGFGHIYAQRDFTVQLIGEMYQFYVRKDARKSRVPRELATAMVAQWDAWDCKRVYVEGAPGMRDEKSIKTFCNLWGKYGFQPIGAVMMRSN